VCLPYVTLLSLDWGLLSINGNNEWCVDNKNWKYKGTMTATRMTSIINYADVNDWFWNNLLSLNLDETTYLQFLKKNSQILDLNIVLLNNQITNSRKTKFLGLTIEETLSWKCHINQVLSRLSSACHAIKVITSFMSEDTLKMIYYSYIHSILTYGIIFWGNSPHNTDIFKIQKRIIRIMTKSRTGDPCRRCLMDWKYYLYSSNTYSVYYYLW
jgi:hypothetical protein